MKSKDIRLVPTCAECPEQYDAYDPAGNPVGYIRVRWGICAAWCTIIDGAYDKCVYSKNVRGWWKFNSEFERKFHLWRIRRAFAKCLSKPRGNNF